MPESDRKPAPAPAATATKPLPANVVRGHSEGFLAHAWGLVKRLVPRFLVQPLADVGRATVYLEERPCALSDGDRLLGALAGMRDRGTTADVAWLYEALTILDQKASGLLGFNAIVITAATVAVPTTRPPLLVIVLFVLGTFLLLRACLECLRILNVEWPFLAKEDPQDEVRALAAVTDRRRIDFRFARNASVVGTVLLVAAIAGTFTVTWSTPLANRPTGASAAIAVPRPAHTDPRYRLAPGGIVEAVAGRSALGEFTAENTLLADALRHAAMFAHAPVSSYEVGALCLGGSGRVYFGANLETSAAPIAATLHAEQAAILNAARHGETSVDALAVSSSPCGHCRQFLQELPHAEGLRVLILPAAGQPIETTLGALQPHAFSPAALGAKDHILSHGDPRGKAKQQGLRAVDLAFLAQLASHAPYTGWRSGAAAVFDDGTTILAPRAESVAFNPTVPAEVSLLSALCLSQRPVSALREVGLTHAPNTPEATAHAAATLLRRVLPGTSLTSETR